MSNEQLTTMNQASLATLNKHLSELEESGAVKLAELQPSLGGLLSDPEQGGFPGRAFLGEVKGYLKGVSMPSTLGGKDDDEDREVDQLEVKDVTGDYAHTTFTFHAGNGGLKAKLAKLQGAKHVLVVYRGEMDPRPGAPKAWNKPKDFGFVEILDLKAGQDLYAKVKALYPKAPAGK